MHPNTIRILVATIAAVSIFTAQRASRYAAHQPWRGDLLNF
jgi:hypothetical protein